MLLERQVRFWIAGVALLALLLYLLGGVLMPFVAGMALAYLLDPLADRLQRLGMNRLVASLVILAMAVLAIALVLILLVPVLLHQFADFLERLPGYVTQLRTLATEEGGNLLNRYGGGFLERLGLAPGQGSSGIENSLGELIRQGAQWLLAFARSLWSGGQALIGVLSLFVVTPVVAFYMLLDWDRMVATIDAWVPPAHRDVVRRLAGEIDAAIAGFLRGQSLVCLFLGAWYAIGLSVIGLNFGLLIGIAGGFFSFIPYVGTLMVFVFAMSLSVVQGWPNWGLPLLAFGVVATGQFLEGNVLTPRLVGHSIGLHPVWLMFALLAFGALFGFTGLLIAVPVSAAIGVLARFALRQYLTSEVYLGPRRPPADAL
jgi:predicted PurR-regulated permease PerM